MSDRRQQTAAASQPPADERPGRRRAVRVLIGGLLVLVTLTGIGLVLAPSLLGGVARGIAEETLDESLKGRVTVDGASLSWFGPQRINGIAVRTPDGATEVARLDLVTDASVFQILGADFGEVRLSGTATATRDPAGEIDLLRAVAPSGTPAEPGASAEGGGLEPATRLTLVLDGISLDLVDNAPPGSDAEPAAGSSGGAAATALANAISRYSLSIPGGRVTLANGDAAIESLTAVLAYARRGDEANGASVDGPTLSLNGGITGLLDGSGAFDLADLTLDLSVGVSGPAGPIFDDVLAQEGRLAAAMDRETTGEIRLTGGGLEPVLTATIDAGAVSLRGSVRGNFDEPREDGGITGRIVSGERPLEVTLRTEPLAYLIPDGSGDAPTRTEFTQFPTLTVTVDDLTVTLAETGPDLSRSGAQATASMTRFAGRIERIETGEQIDFLFPEFSATIDARDPTGLIEAEVPETTFRLGGREAGTVYGKLDLRGLFSEAGEINLDPLPRPEGTFKVAGLDPAVVQPLADAFLDIEVSVVETLGEGDMLFELIAEPATAGADDGETRVRLTVTSDRFEADGILLARDGLIRSIEGEPITVRASGLRPILSALVAQTGAPVMFTEITEAEGEVNDFELDLAGPLDLSAVRLNATLELDEAAFIVTTAGDAAGDDGGAAKGLRLELGLGGRGSPDATLKAEGSAFLDGRPAGSLDVDLRAGGVLSEMRALTMQPIIAAIDGEAEIVDFDARFLQPFLDEQIDARDVLGRSLTLRAGVNPIDDADVPPRIASPAGTSLVTLKINPDSGVITGRGELIASARGVAVRADKPIRLVHNRPGESGEAVLRILGSWPETATLESAGRLELIVRDLVLPYVDIPDLIASARGRVELALRDVGLSNRAPDGARDELNLESADLAIVLEETRVPRIETRLSAEARTGAGIADLALEASTSYDQVRDTLTLSIDRGAADLNELLLGMVKRDDRPVALEPLRLVIDTGALTLPDASNLFAAGDAAAPAGGLPAFTLDLAGSLQPTRGGGEYGAFAAALRPVPGSPDRLAGRVVLDRLDTAWVDTLLADPDAEERADLLAGLLGPRLRLALDDLTVALPGPGDGDEPPPFSTAIATLRVESGAIPSQGAAVRDPRLTTPARSEVILTPNSIELAQQLRIALDADDRWLTGTLAGGADAGAVVRGDVRLEAIIDRLSVRLIEGGGIDPAFDVALVAGRTMLATGDGDLPIEAARIELESVEGERGAVRLAGDILAAPPGSPSAIRILRLTGPGGTGDGRLVGLLDADGALTLDRAALNARLAAQDLPLGAIDAALGLGGLLPSAVGNSGRFDITLTDFPRVGGTVDVTGGGSLSEIEQLSLVVAPGTNAGGSRDESGARRDLRLERGDEIRLRIDGFTREFGTRVAGFIPVFGEISKEPGRDEPGTLTVSRLNWPFFGYPAPPDPEDGPPPPGADLTVITGRDLDASVNIAGVRYGLRDEVAGVLATAIASRMDAADDLAGRTSLAPFSIDIVDGVAGYRNIFVPIGEFTLEARGSHNLLTLAQDHTVLIPVGALATEAINDRGVTRVLGNISDDLDLPLRLTASGPDADLEADLEVDRLIDQINPRNLIREAPGILDRLFRDDDDE